MQTFENRYPTSRQRSEGTDAIRHAARNCPVPRVTRATPPLNRQCLRFYRARDRAGRAIDPNPPSAWLSCTVTVCGHLVRRRLGSPVHKGFFFKTVRGHEVPQSTQGNPSLHVAVDIRRVLMSANEEACMAKCHLESSPDGLFSDSASNVPVSGHSKGRQPKAFRRRRP